MSTQPQQYIVQISTPKEKAVLSKSQKEFNRLIQTIEELSGDVRELREVDQHIQQRVQRDYRPVLDQYIQLKAGLIRLFDRSYDRKDFSKSEKKKLADLIREIAFELIDTYRIENLKPVYDKYDEARFDRTNAELKRITIDQQIKEKMTSMFGIDFDENADVSDPQKMNAYGQEQLAQREAERQQQAAEHRTKKPKSAKQQEREAKKLVEARNITKAVRTLYMDLVKAFHPDREPDETEKIRKTEIMHRVTAAYEKSDLLALLRLQLEFERIDQTHLENLAEEQLKYYNKILRQQAEELDGELAQLQQELAVMTGKSVFTVSSPIAVEFSLNNNIAQLKRNSKQIKADIRSLTDPVRLKQWLKVYPL